MAHYRELLEAAHEGGHRWTAFGQEPQPGDLFLRHDVDLSLDAAIEMAEAEAEVGARATYFLISLASFLTSSYIYSFLTPDNAWFSTFAFLLGFVGGPRW